jgi:nucleoside-diphosphate-sugar epimerase
MHLMRALTLDPAYERVVLVDIAEPRELSAKADYFRADVCEEIDLKVTGEVEVYNFAAVHTTPGHEDWEYYWTNVAGATNACRFARRVGARRMVFASTMSVYGPQEVQVDETTVPRPVNAYGRSKLLAEHIHRDWQANDAANRLLIVRPAVIFGEGERGNFTRLAELLRRGLFLYPGRTDTIKACAPVEDLARSIAFMAAFEEPSLTYIYAYPERTTTEAINRSFADAAGFGMPSVVVPAGVMMAGAVAFEMLGKLGLRTPINRTRVGKLLHSTNVYPGELLARGWTFRHPLTEALARWKTVSDFK